MRTGRPGCTPSSAPAAPAPGPRRTVSRRPRSPPACWAPRWRWSSRSPRCSSSARHSGMAPGVTAGTVADSARSSRSGFARITPRRAPSCAIAPASRPRASTAASRVSRARSSSTGAPRRTRRPSRSSSPATWWRCCCPAVADTGRPPNAIRRCDGATWSRATSSRDTGPSVTEAAMNARRVGVAAAGVWWLALATAFLSNRQNDVGDLPALAGAVASRLLAGPIFGRGALDSLTGLLIAIGIGLAWYGLGAAIVHRAMPPDRPRPPAMHVAERALVGAAAWSLLWFFLGLLPLYRTSVAVAALALGLGAAALALPRPRPSVGAATRIVGASALALLATTQLLALMAALAPPTAKDTLLYHYAVPKAWIAAGRAIELPYNIA